MDVKTIFKVFSCFEEETRLKKVEETLVKKVLVKLGRKVWFGLMGLALAAEVSGQQWGTVFRS